MVNGNQKRALWIALVVALAGLLMSTGQARSADSARDRIPRGVVEVDIMGGWPLTATGRTGRRFRRQIPKELTDAARVDGASEFQILSRVILPLSGSALTIAQSSRSSAKSAWVGKSSS